MRKNKHTHKLKIFGGLPFNQWIHSESLHNPWRKEVSHEYADWVFGIVYRIEALALVGGQGIQGWNINPDWTEDHASRVWKSIFGVTIMETIQERRLHHVMNHLEANDMSNKMIAQVMRFTDEPHLSKFVKMRTGMTVQQHRDKFEQEEVVR